MVGSSCQQLENQSETCNLHHMGIERNSMEEVTVNNNDLYVLSEKIHNMSKKYLKVKKKTLFSWNSFDVTSNREITENDNFFVDHEEDGYEELFWDENQHQDDFIITTDKQRRKRKQKNNKIKLKHHLKKKACVTIVEGQSCNEITCREKDISFEKVVRKIQPLPDCIKYLKSRDMKKQFNKVHNACNNELSRKRNIDKKLIKLGLQRIPPKYHTRCDYYFESKREKKFYEKSMKHTLKLNNKTNIKISNDTSIEFLIDLQYRDVTPEDYDLLLLLDETVKQKSSGTAIVKKLPDVIKTEMGDLCIVCMEKISIGQTILALPKCKHEFHKECIVMWLENFSEKCPVDNIEVA